MARSAVHNPARYSNGFSSIIPVCLLSRPQFLCLLLHASESIASARTSTLEVCWVKLRLFFPWLTFNRQQRAFKRFRHLLTIPQTVLPLLPSLLPQPLPHPTCPPQQRDCLYIILHQSYQTEASMSVFPAHPLVRCAWHQLSQCRSNSYDCCCFCCHILTSWVALVYWIEMAHLT